MTTPRVERGHAPAWSNNPQAEVEVYVYSRGTENLKRGSDNAAG